ncbi:hypothetical protein MASR1M60_10440 [Rhodocyclaceae bacterium]
MGILTNIIAAEEDEVEAIGESLQPLDEWSGIALRDLTIPRIVMLHCLLTGDLFDDAFILYEPIYLSAAEGALVLRMAEGAVARLADLDEEALAAVADELMATEEYEDTGWSDEDVGAMLAALGDLARLAESQGQTLFVWLHPLRT